MKTKLLPFLVSIITLVSCDKHEVREIKDPISGQLIEQYEVLETDDGSFLKDGYYKTWHSNGQIEKDGFYSLNKKDGEWKMFYSNGQKRFDCTYKNDSLENEFQSWYKNGQLASEGTYKNGKQVDKWRGFYEEGKEKNVEQYVSGKLNGKQEYWYSNGQMQLESYYENGEKTGNWKQWDQDGTLVRTHNFVNGKDQTILGKWNVDSGYTIDFFPDGTYIQYLTSSGGDRSKGNYEVQDEVLIYNRSKYIIKQLTETNYTVSAVSFFGSKTYIAKKVEPYHEKG